MRARVVARGCINKCASKQMPHFPGIPWPCGKKVWVTPIGAMVKLKRAKPLDSSPQCFSSCFRGFEESLDHSSGVVWQCHKLVLWPGTRGFRSRVVFFFLFFELRLLFLFYIFFSSFFLLMTFCLPVWLSLFLSLSPHCVQN